MEAYYSSEYGIRFLYPKSWELQIIPDPLRTCEYEIRLRPPSWLEHLASYEWRRYSDFPIQIWLCKKDYITLAASQGYIKKEGQWVTQGTVLDTANVKGKGWHGFVGEVPFKPLPKGNEPGPELYLQQAVIGIDKDRSILVVMEYMQDYMRQYMKAPWRIKHLLQSLEVGRRDKGTFFRTSYDCKASKSDVEKTICMNKDLANFDVELNALYKASLSKLPQYRKAKIQEDQRQWLKERNSQCQSEQIYDCLKEKYSKRISELKSLK